MNQQNLDSKTSEKIMKLLLTFTLMAIPLLMTHEEEVAAYAHRIIRLRDGGMVKATKQIALLQGCFCLFHFSFLLKKR
jgi:ABC-type lipoprotein export system ATPase subunit